MPVFMVHDEQAIVQYEMYGTCPYQLRRNCNPNNNDNAVDIPKKISLQL